MQLQVAGKQAIRVLHQNTKTAHQRWVAIALLVILCYLPTWCVLVFKGMLEGSSELVLNLGFFGLGIQTLRQNRDQLRSWRAEPDDQFLGYVMIVTGICAFAFFHGVQKSASFQALSAMLMLSGICFSTWGLQVFQRFPVSIGLFLAGFYPSLEYLAIRICRFFTSEDLLERSMAEAGSLGLNLIGFKATTQGAYVLLPAGAVWVGPGCSGFSMALVLLGTGFLIGKFTGMTWRKTLGIMLIGWFLAMIFNVPRIMLLAIASVYWGKQSFEFWHGPIGGQIFAGVLFTIYYYAAMWIIDRRSISA